MLFSRKIERLQIELDCKSQLILQLEGEKSSLKLQNKELQIQLEFKRAQTKYYQSSISHTLKSEPSEPLPSEKFRIKGPSSDLNRIYEKYATRRIGEEGGRRREEEVVKREGEGGRREEGVRREEGGRREDGGKKEGGRREDGGGGKEEVGNLSWKTPKDSKGLMSKIYDVQKTKMTRPFLTDK